MDMTPIKVYCRLKPSRDLIKYEIIAKKHKLVYLHDRKMEKFQFQKVFDDNTTQSSIFKHVAVPILEKFLSGRNGTIFAYGQTGSGKSHTIYGSRKDPGIIPRSLKYLFDNKSAIKSSEELEIFSMSYFEIYNEIVYDLLPSTKSRQINKSNVNNKNLRFNDTVRFTVNKKGDVDFKNLNVIKVKNVSEALKLLISGNAKRQVSSTSMNNQSSRSHCICRIEYSNKTNRTKSNEIILNLVDLAGSECISKINNDKQTIAESRYINLSLMHLHQVINCLASRVQPIHVPYRNSTITKLLKGSLGFNCATAMIITIILNYRSIVESTSTCKYARDVSGIKPIVKPEILEKRVKLRVAKRVDLSGDNVRHSVHHDKHVTNCEIETVVVSSNVPAGFGVMADMRFGVKSVLGVANVDNDNRNSDNQMIKVNGHDGRLELNNLAISVPLVDMIWPRLMESGDGVSDNQKTTKVGLIGDNVRHYVRDEKHIITNCETQTVILSNNVPAFGIMADMQCGDSRRWRFGLTSAYLNYLFLFVIMMVIFTWTRTNESNVNTKRLYSAIDNILKCLKPGSCNETIASESLPTHHDPVEPYEDCGHPQCYSSSYSNDSHFYSKTVQQNVQCENLVA